MAERTALLIGGDWNWVIADDVEWQGKASPPTNKGLKILLKTNGLVDIRRYLKPGDRTKTRGDVSRLDKWIGLGTFKELWISTEIDHSYGSDHKRIAVGIRWFPRETLHERLSTQ